MSKILFILVVLLSFFSACRNDLDTSKLKETYKSTNVTNWAYVGWAPRISSAKNVALFLSKQGLSLRVSATLGKEDIKQYLPELIARGEMLKSLSQNGKLSFVERNKLDAYIAEIDSYQVSGKDSRALLLEKMGPYLTEKSGNEINLDIIYPITISAEGIEAPPNNLVNYFQTIEERRDYYSVDPESFVFGSFPALWFDGSIGLHGPIRYTDDPDANRESGLLTEENTEGKPARWQLLRTYNSHGCVRMEGEHIMELRSMLPKGEVELKRVPLYIKKFYDITSYSGKQCPQGAPGTPDESKLPVVIGVQYYWFHFNHINPIGSVNPERDDDSRDGLPRYLVPNKNTFYEKHFAGSEVRGDGNVIVRNVDQWKILKESDQWVYKMTGHFDELQVCEFANRRNFIVEFNPGENHPDMMARLNKNAWE